MEKYHLAVIGSGPGGYLAAIRAAQLGMRVAVIERDKIVGICLNWACIPEKAIHKRVEIYEYFEMSVSYGINGEGLAFDYSKVFDRSRNASYTLTKGVEFLFKKNGSAHLQGTGKLITRNKIGTIRDKNHNEIEAENVLIATGSVPKTLPGLEIDGKLVITSDEAIVSKDLPNRLSL